MLGVDNNGCVYFERNDTGERFLAAFPAGVVVTRDGVRTLDDREHAFGDEIAVDRTYATFFDDLTRAQQGKCAQHDGVFGVGF